MNTKSTIKVGISIGDMNGIGPEIILKSLQDSRVLELFTPVIFANSKVMSFFGSHFKIKLQFHGISKAEEAIEGKINVVNVWKETAKINFGEEDKSIGGFAIKSLKAATEALINKDIDTLVTAPIHKNSIQSDDFNFPGHTDFLAQELKGDSLMFMVSDNIKVGLLTDHVPVKDVSSRINEALITKKVNAIHESLKKDFRIREPKIAVLGINPHSGDGGVIGKEDDEVIRPAVKQFVDDGKFVFGPYAADSFFGSKNNANFDAIIAAYHDQGLIPFKTLSFGNGVNFTAGLNRVRTSPDHGTAFDIAGKGIAESSSFSQAIFMSISIFRNRMEYLKLTKNPL
ncbi:4-hydroxythreonine-4-phosphate dehydrogenase PdxA [Psychroflexus sp. YR1-1]|uniref:4-hydroxythreonine-4-phosphate dehydrogenase PdxA n=1 Tax=Psychroflexus aurantiacus TaxID=2709310 RepID=A0A6B3R3H1_9FLAO|nr:4-hydroxythreonine-4-phosphate dehydrogenase PdxA [Psychroflexus aurantiacus]NEV94598.1 4-hydroxythreonine-4-phosphate dehydrogenase PdxA [Psychroflexus aurantiacus]